MKKFGKFMPAKYLALEGLVSPEMEEARGLFQITVSGVCMILPV